MNTTSLFQINRTLEVRGYNAAVNHAWKFTGCIDKATAIVDELQANGL